MSTVLIADDSLLIRVVVRACLEEEGYQVIEADDGTSTLRVCQQCRPDVVLLDVQMPGLTGHQVLARLKHDEVLKDIPVVFLTARTSMEDVVAGLRGGAHDYLRKPFEPAELVARVGAAAHVKNLHDQLRERNAELERLSRTDALTGLYNRRHLGEILNACHGTALRHGEPLAVILLDIDHFKRINDAHGHPVGDLVLREFSRRLRDQLRVGDLACRWGGEEFIVVAPHTDLTGAFHLAERIRHSIGGTPIAANGHRLPVTVSGGCVEGPGRSPDDLIRRADALLYRAKQSGRNQIVADHTPAVQ